jgi:hypothetical protein
MAKEYGQVPRAITQQAWSYIRRYAPGKISEAIGSLRHVPAYIAAICKQWVQILFGESMLAVAFLIWWALGSPPLPVIFASAVVVAGFFVWCAEYVKSLPKFAVSDFVLQPTPIVQGATIVGQFMYIQLILRCLTEAQISGCIAYLICIYKENAESKWEATGQNETSIMNWSACEDNEITLEPKAERRLNVCHSMSINRTVFPDAKFLHQRAAADMQIPGKFSYDIKITAKDCKPKYVSLIVDFQDNQFDKPVCTLKHCLTMESV